MGRGLTILLIASLGLNVFAAGFLAARLVDGDKPKAQMHEARKGGHGNPLHLMRYAENLPPESREAFRAAVRDDLPVLRAHHREMRQKRRQLFDLLTAEEWDRAAIEAQLAEMNEIGGRQIDAFGKTYLDALEALSVEDRRLLIEAARKHRRHHRRGGHDGRERRDRPRE